MSEASVQVLSAETRLSRCKPSIMNIVTGDASPEDSEEENIAKVMHA